jgi:pimeloyl-ACP methyl ester carboxylesterase
MLACRSKPDGSFDASRERPRARSPNLLAARSEYTERAPDPFIRESNAVIAHDALAQLARIKAPTQITLGRHDQVCGPRFADTLTSGIKGSELVVFETCSHAPIYQSTAEFNEKTLSFLKRQTG